MYEIERLPQSIDIGFTGEIDFRTVQIDMSEWVAKVPEGQPTLMHIRPGEYEAYPVEITFEDNIVTWSVSDEDLGTKEGTGLLQVWFGVQDETEVMRQLGMSAVVATIVHLSLAGEGHNSSTVQIPWLKEVMEMKNIILGYDYEAESWANGQRGGEDVGSDDPAYHNNAKYYKEQVEDMASDAEAYAAGTRGGEAVDEDDPAYHNNASYYNDQAALEKAAAQAAAETASAAYNVNLLAANYDATKTYAVGEYVIYSGGLYRCISAITTAEAWTAAHWSSVTVGKDTSALKSAFDANQNDTADAYGVNFFNPYALIRNTHLFSDGIPAASDNYDCTDFIDVGSATKFTFKLFEYSGTCSFLTYQYASDKTFIKRTSNSSYITGRTFNLESNTKYIRFSVDHTSSGTINPYKVMCVWGEATLSEFVPYFTAYDRTARADAQTRALLSGTVYNFNRTDVPSDCDNVTENSIHYIQTGDTIAHFPFTGTHQAGWLITITRSSNQRLQIAIEAAYGTGFYIRTRNSGTWLAWHFVPWITLTAITPAYDNTQTYDLGDFVMQNSELYFCKSYIPTAESWNADHWQSVSIMGTVKAIREETFDTSSLAMFTKVGCIGDSFTAGYLYNKNNVEPDYVPDGSYPAISYPAVMGRLYGIETQNWGKAGATTASWITDKLPAVLAADPQQLYIIALGLNDNTQSVPIADAIANVKTIVDSILVHAPSAKFVIVKSLWVLRAGDHATYPYGVTGYYTYISQLAEAISEYYGFPYIETMGDPFFCGKAYVDGLHGFHPTAPLYAGMAKRLGQLLDKCIIDNPDYFFNFYIPND